MPANVDHPGMKGKIREIAVKNLFKPLLTKNIAIGSGKIVDHRGIQSKETDVILYSNDIHPAILYSEHDDIGLFPVETCLYAIEVKSTNIDDEVVLSSHLHVIVGGIIFFGSVSIYIQTNRSTITV